MPILGVIDSAKSNWLDSSAYFPIATTTLATTTSSITFSSIPQTYTHLQIRGVAQGNSPSVNSETFRIQLNGDTAANYSTHGPYGSSYSGSGGVGTTGVINAASATAISAFDFPRDNSSYFAPIVYDILNYTNTSIYKTVRSIAGTDMNQTGYSWLGIYSGLWLNTAAVTSVRVFPNADSWKANTKFTLYGIKG
jgi:hypothetical protein